MDLIASGAAMPAPQMARRDLQTMGGLAELIVVDDAQGTALHHGAALLDDLHARWTRFVAGSELDQVNHSDGEPIQVSVATLELVSVLVDAWRRTGGLFDPTVIDALEARGYDCDFADVLAREASSPVPATVADVVASQAPGASGISIDLRAKTVTMPSGVRLDAGGIGKGLAADLAANELVARGAAGACVNLAGDLRAIGRAPDPRGWIVAVEDPWSPDRAITTLAFAEGAVASSSVLVRRWGRLGGSGEHAHHHVIDPATGAPVDSGLAAVTVIAETAWWADALTKAVLVAGPDAGIALLEDAGVDGLAITSDRTVLRTSSLAHLEVVLTSR